MRKAAFLIALLLFALPGGVSRAQVKIATIETPPWAYNDPATGRPEGVFPDVVRELERRTGVAFAMSLIPFPRIAPELESGAQDCAVSVWLESAGQYAVKGEEVASHSIGVVPRRGVPLESYADLRGLILSTLPGLVFGEPFDSDSTIRKVRDPDYLTGVRKAAHGRVDGVAGAVPTILYIAGKEELAAAFDEPFVLARASIVLQFSKVSPHLGQKPRLDQALAGMRREGALEAIRSAHYGGLKP